MVAPTARVRSVTTSLRDGDDVVVQWLVGDLQDPRDLLETMSPADASEKGDTQTSNLSRSSLISQHFRKLSRDLPEFPAIAAKFPANSVRRLCPTGSGSSRISAPLLTFGGSRSGG